MSGPLPPALPPPSAFAVEGAVHPAVAAALAEARRIRDRWAESLAAAEQAQEAEHRRRLQDRLETLAHWASSESERMRDQALALAEAVAERLVGAALCATPAGALLARVTATLEARPLGPGDLRIHLPSDDAAALAALGLPKNVEVIGHPHLRAGDMVLEGPGGRIDERVSTRVEACLHTTGDG